MTAIRASPIGSSYDTIWDAPRIAAIRENLLFEAHPPIMIPYTPTLTTLKTIRMPISTSATCKGIVPVAVVTGAAQGITVLVTREVTMASPGPRRKRNLFEASGIISSLKKSLPPSASGWKIPKGPARFGPWRSCSQPATLRSARVVYMATKKESPIIQAIRVAFPSMNQRSITSKCMSIVYCSFFL